VSSSLALRDGLLDLLQTAFRLLPWPTEAGLRRVGDPDEGSPVLLTCNYDLTVRRLLAALDGVDAWVVVAPTRGINVWCAAAGGHMSTHQVVSALKTSGVADRVSHRSIVLPQLAATGVLALDVFRRCRWRVRFGPVAAEDLPAYLEAGEKTDAMRRVRFSLRQRIEMAAAWALPTILAVGGALLWLRPGWVLPCALLAAAMAVFVFTAFDRLGRFRRAELALLGVGVSVACTFLAGGGGAALAASVGMPLLLTALLTFDYEGSTPIEGGSHFEERKWTITLDPARCDDLAHDERCIRCGACVVQCPQDALAFEDEAGTRIEPDVIRRYKLNLLGQRTVSAP